MIDGHATLDGFPLTSDEVMELRAVEGFVTPLAPIEPGEPWCVFETRGTVEFLVHPHDAAHYLEHGIVFNGKRLEVTKVDEWRLLGAWQICASDPDANREFTPDVRPSELETVAATVTCSGEEADHHGHGDEPGEHPEPECAHPNGASSATISR